LPFLLSDGEAIINREVHADVVNGVAGFALQAQKYARKGN
jgi:hypothetical protein